MTNSESTIGQIGYFQLLNLTKNKVPFSLVKVDLKVPSDLPVAVAVSLGKILDSGMPMSANSVIKDLSEKLVDKASPIVIICANGKQSKSLGSQLEQQGFINIFTVRGGLEGLLVEVAQGL